jgi:hypothetical protein
MSAGGYALKTLPNLIFSARRTMSHSSMIVLGIETRRTDSLGSSGRSSLVSLLHCVVVELPADRLAGPGCEKGERGKVSVVRPCEGRGARPK